MRSLKQFGIFLDPYYWKTARLIAKSGLMRQYRNTFLGLVWTLLQPLTMILVYAIVMPLIMRFPVHSYPLYLLCTMPMWGFISSTLVGASNSLLIQNEVLKRCMISSTVFPVADTLRFFYVYLISFCTMYSFAILFGMPASWHVLLLPLYLVPVLVSLMALSVGIAFLAPYVRDIGELIMVSMNVMLWFSAVPYPIALVPQELHRAFEWNPFYILMQPVISLVYEHHLPDAVAMGRLAGLMLFSILFGYALYRRFRRNFVYYL